MDGYLNPIENVISEGKFDPIKMSNFPFGVLSTEYFSSTCTVVG